MNDVQKISLFVIEIGLLNDTIFYIEVYKWVY